MRGVIGKKLGMTQLFDQDGNQVPVTVIELQPNHVLPGQDGERQGRLQRREARGR